MRKSARRRVACYATLAKPSGSCGCLFFLLSMNRALVLLSSSLLLASSAHAQLGVRAGGNTAIFTKGARLSDENPTTSRLAGYQVGLYYQVPLTQHLALVPEIQFSRERFSVSYTPFTPPGILYFEGAPHSEYDQSLSYLNLPVLLRASVGSFYLEAGPQGSLLVGGHAKNIPYANGTINNSIYVDQAATSSYRRFDAGPCVGVGVRLPAGLGVGVRAYWGITRLTTDEDYSMVSRTYTGFQHRRTLQASLTYQLPS
ncbi:MAG: PorT family protein [Hymenobacter sp.]|nr:MAG: PorT family protein [Hymenobacter sp.]